MRIGRTLCFVASMLFPSTYVSAQLNSWTNPASGNWENAASWSLGIAPAAGQTISIANHGWKAVSIGNNTAANFPLTMSIDALTVVSPGTDTVNTVLLNYAGLQTPLTIAHDLDVSNDTSLVILQSALQANGNFTVAGTVAEDSSSQVSAGNLMVTNGGLYNLTNSILAVPAYNSAEALASGTVFNQAGGSNYCFGLYDSGEYDFFSGDLVVPGYELAGGLQALNGSFIQYGGTVSGSIVIGKFGGWGGVYELLGGVLETSSLLMPQGPPSGNPGGDCLLFQGGGTNLVGDLSIGGIDGGVIETTVGFSSYTLTNGLLVSTNIAIGGVGSFAQSGGVHSNLTMNLSQSVFFERQQPGADSYFTTNYGYYVLNSGTFVSGLVNAQPGNFSQSAGTCRITSLQMGGGQYTLGGGQLIVSDLALTNGSIFLQIGGTVTQSGTLTLSDAGITAGPGPQQFGALQLSTGGNTNSTLALSTSGTLHFANSSGLAWSSGALLTISGWKGSLSGGGTQQIFFGNDNTGLTSQQLSQMLFSNPAGLSPGTYYARILSNGEVVPDQSSPGPSGSGLVNSWINQNGGNWDDGSSWSFGIPPDSSQSVAFTNYFWKAVTIDSSTLANAPGSLSVSNLTTGGAPIGTETTKNTLLLNYVGAGNPLVIGADTNTPGNLIVGTNSMVVMFSSGLIVNNVLGPTNQHLGEFEVDGNFIQNDDSEVVANFLDLTGSYNFTNSTLFVGNQFINGVFNQQGGRNLGAVDLESTNSDYELFDGALQGNVTVRTGTFNQWGGTNSATLVTGFRGLYNLVGGVLMPGDLVVGSPAQNYLEFPGGIIHQTGGTNIAGNITMTNGTYNLGGGTLSATSLVISTNAALGNLDVGSFDQYGGYHTNGGITLFGGTNDYNGQISRVAAKYYINAGLLVTPSLTMDVGDFGQAAGTNEVGTLSMNASIYSMIGGLLEADQIQLTAGSQFSNNGGTVGGRGNVTLANGTWTDYTSGAQFGQLQLSSGASVLSLQGASCVIQFANSSSAPWAADGLLTIQNWSGSLGGGGAQRVLFGTGAGGLTAQQLTQVQFSNPEGLPNGTYSAHILSNGEVVPDETSPTSGTLNSWTNSASGNWDQSANWSLGVLPDGSQSVLIANSGSKAVSINPSTPVNFPDSMTVSNLFIEGATNTENSLLLNSFGTTVPLTVLNDLTLRNGGQILNFNSGLIVDGTFMITNSDVIQNGGSIRATNGQMYISGGELVITNGDFEAGAVSLGYPVSSQFSQYGGSVKIANLGLASYVRGTNQNEISLYGGTLDLPGGMLLYGEGGGISYFQSGGTNRTGPVTIEVDYGGSDPSFTLNGGLLADSSVLLYSGYHAALTITQNGGSHVVTNTLTIEGSSANGNSTDPATYNLNGGTLSAGTLELAADEGDSVFMQTNSTVYAGTVYAHSGGYFLSHNTHITLAGGSLSCSNFTIDDGRGTLNQSGGALVVSNLLSVGGARNVGQPINYYAVYTFTSGTVTASNINITDWIIGDGTSNRISNPGFFALSDKLQIGNAVEQLGHFILASNAIIDLAGSVSQLSFANSSGQAWTPGATLTISDWNGNPAGGGAEQLKFGTDPSGLTPAQLNQIQFLVGTNVYAAKILSTGEVVPNQSVGPSITSSKQGNNLVMTWPQSWSLQTATNAAGPYSDVQNATSPYTNDMSLDKQRYFRLRQ
ncbi:MAG TPA: hypothetical protein VG938_13625 [Verrucomicrobiae bacterium]|nr:hypothetical protein [Verrucomicrobiae bacterium]